MNIWPHPVDSYTIREIQAAVSDEDWQDFRDSLRGLPTTQKLEELEDYLDEWDWSRTAKVRVDNYVNALKRGGQLDNKLEVKK